MGGDRFLLFWRLAPLKLEDPGYAPAEVFPVSFPTSLSIGCTAGCQRGDLYYLDTSILSWRLLLASCGHCWVMASSGIISRRVCSSSRQYFLSRPCISSVALSPSLPFARRLLHGSVVRPNREKPPLEERDASQVMMQNQTTPKDDFEKYC